MKEHIEYIIDSFTDYAGKVHHFVLAAVSQNLPTCTCELEKNPSGYECAKVFYDIEEYIEDYGISEYFGTVKKVLRLGVSICNPTDTFNEKVGINKAIARARNATPTLFATTPGVINSTMVKALLQQEALYLKNSPENYIPGYIDMRDRYLTKQKMEAMKKEFSELENQVVSGLQKDPKFLDNAMQYLEWEQNQKKGTGQKTNY